jgi:hypothetical protein
MTLEASPVPPAPAPLPHWISVPGAWAVAWQAAIQCGWNIDLVQSVSIMGSDWELRETDRWQAGSP